MNLLCLHLVKQHTEVYWEFWNVLETYILTLNQGGEAKCIEVNNIFVFTDEKWEFTISSTEYSACLGIYFLGIKYL